ncbi:hypothetical protein GQ43DRAFT_452910 [Delitschia confertaspora ATCC 74209]|uniref:Atos-like conserved domain-containing protein n=1 Tax=Delitschia confertaspora ATCC 74209 TaxID=1513339 RepID=A0A9P4MX36_9PLEO|nr:hypothetical protein GQ43DRAFT_452910 [Delitschia confertaspora ATCC 74209]
MPIFHDHYERSPKDSSDRSPGNDDCPITTYTAVNDFGREHLDILSSEMTTNGTTRSEMDYVTLPESRRLPMLSRLELIESIKRANSPSLLAHQNKMKSAELCSDYRPGSHDRSKSPIISTAESKRSRTSTPDPLQENASAGIEIERPRSALHSGDFREKIDHLHYDNTPTSAQLATSPVAPWHHSFPASAFSSARTQSPFPLHPAPSYESRPIARSRAMSQSSFSSPFVLMPPTSPLVQQSNNTDLDSSRPASRHSSRSPERNNRRHTFSPHSFQSFREAQSMRWETPAGRHIKRENTFPYQAHQPRRSLTSSNLFQPHSLPQSPFAQARRPSISEVSPLHHAPMVGSYEESILRGRMSTTPSRPLNFVAQIGVLGKGQCKPNLKCPPHVAVPFPAVFYSYNSGNGRISDNSPSPYVGLIDLENTLTPPEENGERPRRRRRQTLQNPDQSNICFRSSSINGHSNNPSQGELRQREKRKRRSASPKAPPGGSYRIPQVGQLQIIIKNPNKTAVKLFLVPYDLSDMEPGQKTFIRQRSYSAGPIIDMPLSARTNLGTDRPEASLSNSEDPNDRPVLRYLIHLHICSPSKGRFYLYKGVRVVFANRVPDGKEKLRNEIQLPEPRYSTYKPSRDSATQQSESPVAAHLNSEKVIRRRSAGVHFNHQFNMGSSYDPVLVRPPTANHDSSGSTVQPIPWDAPNSSTANRGFSTGDYMNMDQESPLRLRTHGIQIEPFSAADLDTTITERERIFQKLERSDAGYGWNVFYDSTASPEPGLLARRLRGLDVQRDGEEGNEQ